MDTQESPHLPKEIVEEILVRLPVKSLVRFKCVSKPWLSLIDSKKFIITHFKSSTKRKDSAHHRVIIFSDSEPKQYSLSKLLEEPASTHLGHLRLAKSVLVGSCCNGLLCIYRRERFSLLNPSTGVSKELPEDPKVDHSQRTVDLERFGSGWDESSGAYKVFAIWSSIGSCRLGRVYSSKTNSWRAVEAPDLLITIEGMFFGGKLHWLGLSTGPEDYVKRIRSFDLKTEVFGTIKLPIVEKGCHVSLGVVGVCLSVCAKSYDGPFDLWVMKESWEKVASIGQDLIGQIGRYSGLIIGEAGNGEILIAEKSSLVVYCLRTSVVQQRREIGRFDKAHLYVESLASPVDS